MKFCVNCLKLEIEDDIRILAGQGLIERDNNGD